MAIHKFKVGQMVDFNPSPVGAPCPVRQYKILRLLPHDGGEQLYRIKTITEQLDRIARESQIVLRLEGRDQRTVLPWGERPCWPPRT